MLGAVGLLVAGLVAGSTTVQWASFGASSAAVVLLVAGELRRRRRARAGTGRRATTEAPPRGAPPGGARGGASVVRLPPATLPPVPRTDPGLRARLGQGADGRLDAGSRTDGRGTPRSADLEPGRPPGSSARLPDGPATGAHARSEPGTPSIGADGEPPAEEVEVTDLLLVLDLTDEVLVVDEHPRYHLPRCPHLAGTQPVPLPMVEARTDGFTPCGACAPDRELARRERARRSA